jgi:hypothetical protein
MSNSGGCGPGTIRFRPRPRSRAFTGSAGGARYGSAYSRCFSITALVLLVPSVGFMLVIERFLKADVLAKVGS